MKPSALLPTNSGGLPSAITTTRIGANTQDPGVAYKPNGKTRRVAHKMCLQVKNRVKQLRACLLLEAQIEGDLKLILGIAKQ
jgi:hypothetical protein